MCPLRRRCERVGGVKGEGRVTEELHPIRAIGRSLSEDGGREKVGCDGSRVSCTHKARHGGVYSGRDIKAVGCVGIAKREEELCRSPCEFGGRNR